MPGISGRIVDINGQPVTRKVRAYDRSTGALLAETTSSAVTGNYSLTVATTDEVQVVMLDDAAGVLENDQILRVIPV